MSYRLVITEKPSVAQAYAKVLGATNRNDGYLEGGGYLVSWCVGHLVELAPPNIYDEKHVNGAWPTSPSCRKSGSTSYPLQPRNSSVSSKSSCTARTWKALSARPMQGSAVG